MKKFIKDDLDFFLPDSFKGIDKKYMMACIFNEEIQEKWVPTQGDIIVGCTGNVFVISSVSNLSRTLGGTMYFYGGGHCNKDSGNVMDSTYCYTANKSGNYYHPTGGKQDNLFHSSIKDFKFVPYPHELEIMNIKLVKP